MQVSQIVHALPVLLCIASAAAAQGSRYRVSAENAWFHQEAGGRRLARLAQGATFAAAAAPARDGWVQITLDGWIFAASTGPSPRPDFDLVVTGAPEENLRASAGGTVIARLAQGFGLRRASPDTQPPATARWIHVRRDGWVPRAALEPAGGAAPAVAAMPPAPPPGDTARGAAPAAGARAQPTRMATLFRAPDGPEAGAVSPETPVRVLSRTGEWARVQLEGWMRADELQPSQSGSGVLVGVSAAEVRTEPQRYAGQVLRWRLEFIALQKADDLRPDIPSGTSYVLARGPLPERGFVYLIVPETKLPAVRVLAPLATMQVTARVRAGRSRYLGNPVLELISLEAGGGGPTP